MKLTFLGTSCMVPTKERNVSSFHIEYDGSGILFDCGEGTQRQMQIAGLNRNKITTICISHWHADHVGGLMGLLQTMSGADGSSKKVTIYGPKETKKRMNHILETSYCNLSLELDIIEVTDATEVKTILETKDYKIKALNLDHGIPSIGFSFTQTPKRRIDTQKINDANVSRGPHLAKLVRGETAEFEGKKLNPDDYTFWTKEKKISYVADTAFKDNLHTLATNADVLISESTYTTEFDIQATKYKHMTATQAATIAKKAKVKALYITHFSQRFKQADELVNEAKETFENSFEAVDFLEIKI